MKNIVIGSTGFMGQYFLEADPYAISLSREKTKGNWIQFDIFDIDYFFHAHGKMFEGANVIFLIGCSNHHLINKGGSYGFEMNLMPLKKILGKLEKLNINKFVCFTSILLYGDKAKGYPVSEFDTIYPFQNEYIFSKAMAEEVCRFYQDRIPIINVRLSNIYGATNLNRPDLVPTLMRDVIKKDNPSVWNKTPKRDFIYVKDAVTAVLKLVETDFEGYINIGSGKCHSVGELCDIVTELSGKQIKDLGKDVAGVAKFITDISVLKSTIEWEPEYSLRKGLEETYQLTKQLL